MAANSRAAALSTCESVSACWALRPETGCERFEMGSIVGCCTLACATGRSRGEAAAVAVDARALAGGTAAIDGS